MAQAIVTWCDRCLDERDEQVPGFERDLSSFAASGNLLIDLCEPCWDALTGEVRALVAKMGRSPEVTGEGRLRCPICNESLKDRGSVNSHMQGQHDTTLPAYETKVGRTIDGRPTTFPCPEGCGLMFATAGSAGTHAARAHRMGKRDAA